MRSLVEVTLVFGCAHLLFRSARQFTAWGRFEVQNGWNFSTGLILAACALVALGVGRRSPAHAGLHLHGARGGVQLGLTALALVAVAGVPWTMAGLPSDPRQLGPTSGLLAFAGGVLVTAVLLACTRRGPLSADGATDAATIDRRGQSEHDIARPLRADAPRRDFVRTAAILALVLALLLLPTTAAALTGRAAPAGVAAATVWRFLCAGFGEEIFFRGYVQSRLNDAFGRPWRLWGVSFGFGLVGAALMFGVVHVLNPCDYFGGPCALAWWHGLATVSMPYGFLREKSGSIIAPAILHGLLDVLVLVNAP